jgi:LCP family protein required for cell wall assembly
VSPPTDRRSASGGLLESPPPGRSSRSASSAHWAASTDDLWDERDRAAGGPATDPKSARGGDRGGAHGPQSARARRQDGVIPLRRWPRRILILANVMVGLLLASAVGVYGYVNWRFGQITRITIPSILGSRSAAAPGAPMTILVVGSDTRTGLAAAGDTAQFGSGAAVGGQRSDTIMLVHVDPASTTATLMSIPRDLYVQIPGKSYRDRINSTFDTGPDLLVKTIEMDLGINIDHYVEVNFDSFRQVVNAVGGVKEYFPTPARDAYSLLNIPKAGCYTLTGDMALSFVRARHYEYQVNGRWVYEAESDLARIKRQQSFIKKMIAKAQGSGLTNPLQLNNIVAGVTTNLTLDSGFSQNLLLTLAKRFRNLSPDSLPTATLPTTPATIGGAAVLLLQQPQAQTAIADFLHQGSSTSTSTTNGSGTSTTSNIAPSSVYVSVLNGSGRTGEASKTGSDLARQGFQVTSTHSANNFNYTTSVIRYRPGNEAKAQLLASAVQGGTQLQADSSIQGADLVLITGQSYQGISTLPVSGTTTPKSTSATTAPATPPTTTYELPGTPAGFVPPAC